MDKTVDADSVLLVLHGIDVHDQNFCLPGELVVLVPSAANAQSTTNGDDQI